MFNIVEHEASDFDICPDCNGGGKILKAGIVIGIEQNVDFVVCPKCNSTGFVRAFICVQCNGTGTIKNGLLMEKKCPICQGTESERQEVVKW